MTTSATITRVTAPLRGRPGIALRRRFAAGVVGLLAATALQQTAASAEAKTDPSASRTLQVRADRIILQDLAQADNRLLAVGERGIIMLSDDAGKTWQPRFTATNRTLSGLAMADAQRGVAVGHGGTVLTTADGGLTWKAVTVDAAGKDALLGVLHAGGTRYVAWGAFGLFVESADNGATWERKQPLGPDFDRHLSHIAISGEHWLLVGESGTLARSSDAGKTWESIKSPYPGSFFGALATADGALLAFGMRGNIYRSADRGASWTKIESGTALALMSGRRLADGRLVLVGNTGVLAVSSDNGNSFTLQKSARGRGLAQLVQVSTGPAKGTLVAVGEAGAEQLSLKK